MTVRTLWTEDSHPEYKALPSGWVLNAWYAGEMAEYMSQEYLV
jgi:hypothetical protein